MSACIYVYVWAYLWGVHLYIKAPGWSWKSSSVILYLIYWGKVFDVSPELTNMTSLAVLGLSCFCFPSAGIPGRSPMPNSIYVRSEDPNSSLHVCCYSSKCFNYQDSPSTPGRKKKKKKKQWLVTSDTECLHISVGNFIFSFEKCLFKNGSF